jgi:hypothetical protein
MDFKSAWAAIEPKFAWTYNWLVKFVAANPKTALMVFAASHVARWFL